MFLRPRLIIRDIRPADEANEPETSSMTSEVAAAVESGATSRQSLPARPIGGETAEGRPELMTGNRRLMIDNTIAWQPLTRPTMPGPWLSHTAWPPPGRTVTRPWSQWLSPAQPIRSPGILRTGQPPSPLELGNVVLERAGNARTVELGNARLVNAGNAAVVPVYASAVHTVMAGRPASVGNAVTRAELLGAERVANATENVRTMIGAPEQLMRATVVAAGRPAEAGNVVTLARPVGREEVTGLGRPNVVTRTVTQGQVATAGGVATEQNVQSPTLTQRLNEVYAPVITRTIGSPTTIVARRTVGNVGSATEESVQGGLMVRGPQGGVYIPAQELLAAAAG